MSRTLSLIPVKKKSIITKATSVLEYISRDFFALFKPSLNDQVLSNELNPFRNDVTWVI